MSSLHQLKIAVALCAAATPGVAAAEPLLQAGPPQEFVLNNARHFLVKSAVNGLEYRIFLAMPRGEMPVEGYPVIYTTDGNAMFPQLAANANLLRMNNRAVLVGIGYPGEEQFNSARRYYDLTPKTPEEVVRRSGRTQEPLQTGGHDLFLEFIEKELKPLVEARVKINRGQQTLFGHSLGGLFTLHVLFSRPEAFQNYVAAAPSLWWNEGSILQEKEQFLAKNLGRGLKVNLLVTGNTDPSRTRPTPDQVAASSNSAPTAPATPQGTAPQGATPQSVLETLDTLVASIRTQQGVRGEARVFANETHLSMVPASINSALRFVLGDAQRSGAAPPPQAAPGAGQGAAHGGPAQ